ncbi:TRAP transporter substrate-binding protein DctP [Acuticoccus sp. M5D2P5]|uniref:TRAP transporter substrate-binding protein n=1 Tax=Acuticoccus kalidii TaxID=2910977 RepID=UPI001F259704|nr:TRAP transporter substrate-binding protein DctP [Acuticoccus kalidii]MCF3935483.1 TRAP transporter substrate-binding protein DctP [Acuticoccus kalidii]
MMGKALLATAAVAIGLTGPASAETWTLFTPFTTNDKPTQLYRAFAEDVKAATNGDLVIEVYTGGELPYKNSDVLKALATQQVQIADLAVGPVAGDVPDLNVFVLPFLCTTMDGFYAATAEALPIINERLNSKFGVNALTAWTMPPQEIWLKDGVDGITDLAGRKVRTWNRMQAEMMELFGGSGVSITPAEVIPALQRGVVDGAITAVVPAYDWKFYEVTKYGYMLNFTMTNQLIAVNQAAFDALSPETQTALADTAAAWQDKFRAGIEEAAAAAKTNLEAEGMTLIDPSEADIAKARELTSPLREQWVSENGELADRLLSSVSGACGA